MPTYWTISMGKFFHSSFIHNFSNKVKLKKFISGKNILQFSWEKTLGQGENELTLLLTLLLKSKYVLDKA